MARDIFPRTISRGILRGREFSSKWEYQQARARAMGFESYGAERAAKENSLFTLVRERAVDSGYSRNEALERAREIVGTTRIPRHKEGAYSGTERGKRMREIIRALAEEGLWDSRGGDEEYYFYDA